MTSVKTQLPYEYYSLPFCEPIGGKVFKTENLGNSLAQIHFLYVDPVFKFEAHTCRLIKIC